MSRGNTTFCTPHWRHHITALLILSSCSFPADSGCSRACRTPRPSWETELCTWTSCANNTTHVFTGLSVLFACFFLASCKSTDKVRSCRQWPFEPTYLPPCWEAATLSCTDLSWAGFCQNLEVCSKAKYFLSFFPWISREGSKNIPLCLFFNTLNLVEQYSE